MKYVLCSVVVWALAVAARGAEKPLVEIRAGDRIAFIGNDFFDRELNKGYIETQLTSRFYGQGISFRNLGYSGDTVWCQARNLCSGWDQFGPPDQGFKRLQKLVGEFNPNVIFVAYGMSESFDGPGGVEHFTQGLNRLLDMLTRAGEPTSQPSEPIRVVLFTPIRHEDLGAPLPDPSEHNRNIKLYIDAMQKVARARDCAVIDLFDTLSEVADPQARLTSDGIHLTAYGYWRAAAAIEKAMGYEPRRWQVEVDAKEGTSRADGGEVSDLARGKSSVSFNVKEKALPVLPPLQGTPAAILNGKSVAPGLERIVKVTGLAPGRWELKSQGRVLCVASASEWGRGVQLLTSPDDQQAEDLRERVVAKDFDYFNYWRPENDTYIFGYRKHEQGRNAVEVPNFLKQVQDKEAQINAIAAPDVHKYELTLK